MAAFHIARLFPPAADHRPEGRASWAPPRGTSIGRTTHNTKGAKAAPPAK
jgi:hypothetical protein